MTTLPACCIPSPDASLAETLYCEYQRGGPPERAGLAHNDLPCPTWAELVENAEGGSVSSAGVIAKWEAVAESVRADSASDADEVKVALEQLKTDLISALDKAQHFKEFEALADEVDSGDPVKAMEMAQALERKIGLHPDVTYYKVLAQRLIHLGGEE